MLFLLESYVTSFLDTIIKISKAEIREENNFKIRNGANSIFTSLSNLLNKITLETIVIND